MAARDGAWSPEERSRALGLLVVVGAHGAPGVLPHLLSEIERGKHGDQAGATPGMSPSGRLGKERERESQSVSRGERE